MNLPENVCQSCAMPLSQDPKGGGTEADGSVSADYCSYCYQAGKFHDEGITLPAYVEKLKGIMGTMNMPPQVVEMTVASLPLLKRWRTD